MKVFISGDVTNPQARSKFNSAEEYLRKKSHDPVNPFKLNGTDLAPFPVRFEALSHCGAIFMLTNWINDCESMTEKYYASVSGKKIFFESRIETDNKEELILTPIKGAIEDVTGMTFEEYAKDNRQPGKRLTKCKPMGFYCRMIFTVQCQKIGLDSRQIMKYIPRDLTSILHYLKKYKSEYDFNREFREIAEKVDLKLSLSEKTH